MVSRTTVISLVDLFEDFVDADLMPVFLTRLKEIEGNKSFRDTVAAIDHEVERRRTGAPL